MVGKADQAFVFSKVHILLLDPHRDYISQASLQLGVAIYINSDQQSVTGLIHKYP